MKQIKTLTNSFVLQETDANGKVIFELGYPKGGLTYLIKNNGIKFYLKEDYFYKNLVWTANVPLFVDGVLCDINMLPTALKRIFEMKDEGGGGGVTVDRELNEDSFNPIANSPVAVKVNELAEQIRENASRILNTYTKQETNSLLQSYYTKIETNGLFANYSKVNDTTLSLNDENITI